MQMTPLEGVVAHKEKLLPAEPTTIWAPAPVLTDPLLTQVPACMPGKVSDDGPRLGPLHTCGKIRRSSQLLAVSLASPDPLGIVRNEPVDGRSVSVTDFQIIIFLKMLKTLV